MSETKLETAIILPVLDTAVLQEKANAFAMQGALKSIEEFYTGYNSPYRKAIDEKLKEQKIGHGIKIPDIIAILNENLSNEIDAIANAAIAKTFAPLIKNFLVRAPKEIKFSEILKEFIELTESKKYDECECEIKKSNSDYGWLDITLSGKDRYYNLTIHEDWDTKKEPIKKYHFLSLPYEEEKNQPKMKLTLDGGTLEMPFTRDLLKDNFIAYIAKLIISDTKITMDCKEFDENMFPRDECHCD